MSRIWGAERGGQVPELGMIKNTLVSMTARVGRNRVNEETPRRPRQVSCPGLRQVVRQRLQQAIEPRLSQAGWGLKNVQSPIDILGGRHKMALIQ
jgi:hypothetical protein